MAATVFRPGATALITGGGSGIGFAVPNFAGCNGRTRSGRDPAQTICQTEHSSPEAREWHGDHSVQGTLVESSCSLGEREHENFAREKGEAMVGWANDLTFATNFTGVLNGIYTFLPMISEAAAQGPKAIVITGSKQGITNPPGANNPAYNASKSALKSIAEFLAHDMHSNSATKNVHVHLLIPGWTFTGLTGSEGPIHDDQALALKPKGAWIPSQVARYMYEKMNQGKFYIVCPDEDVSEALDKARMEWAIGDIIEGRPALSRWHEEWKDKASEWINEEAAKR
ncbi:short chain dehydrogenase/reductase [Coccidioides immitis H538.4]|uniref:Short chain dehydrogenase/reductase n=1 Tax=Coccidioides immitis H538.4 TaxID=396776 RepID=A0A0J8UU07_COCIT|nr:short chain dehydrogenase/reductase [Coccidioides immitis H538.4]